MYGVGRLQQRITCNFNQFQIYDNTAEKGCAGGLKSLLFMCFCVSIAMVLQCLVSTSNKEALQRYQM